MAAQERMICLIGVMDRLWFHQIILFSENPSFHVQKPSQSLQDSSPPQDFSPLASATASPPRDDEAATETERPTRLNLNLVSTKGRSQSSSPISAQKRSRNHGHGHTLQKTMSCKRLVDLELQEVKGFMDLGYLFEKENLAKRIISLVPGLQRIDVDEDDEEKKEEILRPYLWEAWITRRPDSPLLNLRIPRASTAADMKRHLRFWAHTVASAIQQQS